MLENKPIVSVIVPCYNMEKYLPNCIEGITKSTYGNIEIILVNDGSTDKTIDICDYYKKLHSNIIVITQQNAGVSMARNVGIETSGGRYLLFLDADDRIEPTLIEKAVEFGEMKNLDVVRYGYKKIVIKDNIVIKEKIYIENPPFDYDNNEDIVRNLIYGICGISLDAIKQWYNLGKLNQHKQYSAVWCHLYKRELIIKNKIKFNSNLRLYEDGMFNCYCFLYAEKVAFLPESLYTYCQRETGSLNKHVDSEYLYDNKVELMRARSELRLAVKAENGIDILEWFSGSLVLSILQICIYLTKNNNKNNGYYKLKEYITEEAVLSSIQMIPVGGKIKFMIPLILLKTKQYYLFYCLVVVANRCGIIVSI